MSEITYTVKGRVLEAAPLSDLKAEATAGRALMASGYVGSWKKLYAVEREIRLRETTILIEIGTI
jgi:hypothetical protein